MNNKEHLQLQSTQAALALCDQEARLLRASIEAALSLSDGGGDAAERLARVVAVLQATQGEEHME